MTYITSRGKWYYSSWKGDKIKSGGIATNIGIHFFDVLTWIFGDLKSQKVHVNSHDRASGVLELKNANVRWFLSINSDLLPNGIKDKGKTTFRSLKIDDSEFEFSDGFTDLHTKSYENILNDKGYGLEQARKSIEIIHDIRHLKISELISDYHPFVKKPQTKHPFFK